MTTEYTDPDWLAMGVIPQPTGGRNVNPSVRKATVRRLNAEGRDVSMQTPLMALCRTVERLSGNPLPPADEMNTYLARWLIGKRVPMAAKNWKRETYRASHAMRIAWAKASAVQPPILSMTSRVPPSRGLEWGLE